MNALFEICSLNDTNDIIEKRFETLVYVLKNGCESSVGKSLPPINWFYLMSSLMKSKCGKTSELNLIELTFRHTETLSSALGFLRNCLISLNSFSQFKVGQY